MQKEIIKSPEEFSEILELAKEILVRETSRYVDEIFIFHPEWSDPDFDGDTTKCGWHKLGKSCPVHDSSLEQENK